jgi:hypothetical protein
MSSERRDVLKPMTRLAYGKAEAAKLLGKSERWMDDAPIPRVDMRKPGAKQPSWAYLHSDLEAWLNARRVMPGQESPLGEQ